jgi:hypothetical protein
MLTDTVRNMRYTLNQYAKLIDFLEKTTAPCMLVSYDKVLINRRRFVRCLASFLNIENEQSIRAAIEFIKPDSERYLDSSRITKSEGVLDKVGKFHVSGWARWVHDPGRVPEIQLLVNGTERMRTKADAPRSDLLVKGIHPTGYCGFSFDLPDQHCLMEGDQVRVKAIGDIRDLKNSPRIF